MESLVPPLHPGTTSSDAELTDTSSSASSSSDSPADVLPKKYTSLPFPPITHEHILHCSYSYWHPLFKALTPRARLIPLTPPFLTYLRADGIVLPSSRPSTPPSFSDQDSGIYPYSSSASSTTSSHSSTSTTLPDPTLTFPELHAQITTTIASLGGRIAPKLNWSAPKDATWISATNSMECRSASDIYLLLKSSDMITHDLEHAFDGCSPAPDTITASTTTTTTNTSTSLPPTIPYVLVLRKYLNINPALEFRCFIRAHRLIAISQRDPTHYSFLLPMASLFQRLITQFVVKQIRHKFPDANYTLDVYIPPPHDRVWVIDFNPWAPRTDPLLFSWLEVLTMDVSDQDGTGDNQNVAGEPDEMVDSDVEESTDESEPEGEGARRELSHGGRTQHQWMPELRLIHANDPEAYSFATPQYSAHKLPRDVVDAGNGGPGAMQEFAKRWKGVVEREEESSDEEDSSADEADEAGENVGPVVAAVA